MRAAPKVMSHILLCWPAISEVDVSGLAVENLPTNIPSHFLAVRQKAAEGQTDTMVSADKAKVCHYVSPCGKNYTR